MTSDAQEYERPIKLNGDHPDPAEGDVVRVVTRNGRVLEGTYLSGWALRQGGIGLNLRCNRRSTACTTMEPIVILRRNGYGFGGPNSPR